ARDHHMFDDIYHPIHPKPDSLRFGLQYADGRKATTMGRRFEKTPVEKTSLVLSPGGGGGSERSFDMFMWVWPLPPAGPVAFVCEWGAESIPLTRHEIDAKQILEAAERSEALWPEEPSDGEGPWTATVFDDGP